MYTIDNVNNKIVFSYIKTSLFEDLKRISAIKSQQIVTKEGVDQSDMFIITDDEVEYLDSWLTTALPYITSSVPQQHLTTTIDSDYVTITSFSDSTRNISEGNIITADGILRNLLIFGCLSEWYSNTANATFAQEYSTKLGENIKLFSEILFDSRKRKVSTLFVPNSGDGRKATTIAEQIADILNLISALTGRVSTTETNLQDTQTDVQTNTDNIQNNRLQIDSSNRAIVREGMRAIQAENSLLEQIQALANLQMNDLNLTIDNITHTYNPKDGGGVSLTINIPKSVTDLSDSDNYPTHTQVSALVTALIAASLNSGDIANVLSAYATRQWVEDNFSGGGGGGSIITDYVDLTSNQNISGVKIFQTIGATGAMSIPTVPPQNPDINKVYLYFSTTGEYAE